MIIKNRFLFDLFFFVLLFLWCSGIAVKFLLNVIPSLLLLVPLLENNYTIVCHANTEKLICVDVACTLTCARCTGIYFGALIFSILFILGIKLEVSLKYLILSSIPIFADILFYSIGIYEYSIFTALTTGLLLGSVGFIYIRNVLFDYLNKI